MAAVDAPSESSASLRTRLLKLRVLLLSLCVAVLGAALLVIPSLLPVGTTPDDLLREFGVAIMTIGVVGVGYDRFVRQDTMAEMSDVIKRAIPGSGLTVFPARNFDRLRELVQSSDEVWITGSSAYNSVNQLRDTLEKSLIGRPLTCRVLVSHEDSPSLHAIDETEGIAGKNVAEVRSTVAILQELSQRMAAKKARGRLEVSTHRRPVYFSCFVFDRRVALLSFYAAKTRSVELPMIECSLEGSGASLVRMQIAHFAALWHDNLTASVVVQGSAKAGHKL